MKYGILLAGFVLISFMAIAWEHNQRMQVPDTNHWIACGSGFFYDMNTYQEGDWFKAEQHALDVCDKHKKRGSHTPIWFDISEGPNNGINSLNSDSVEVDDLLVINWELGPLDHLYTVLAYQK